MSGETVLVTSRGAASYDFGSEHPMRAVRTDLTVSLATDLGVLTRPVWRRHDALPATSKELALVHTDTYVAIVGASDRVPAEILARVGLGPGDTPVFQGIDDAARGVVGGSLAAADAVWRGGAVHAVNLSGGLHHAMAGHASGFCVYNDAAIAIRALLRDGCSRVAYVDLDGHHGDGVEAAFVADPRVLTISLHQHGHTLFPGSGFATDVGDGEGAGYAVNVALPPMTTDSGWLRAFSAVVPLLLRDFAPDVVVTQCGCDAHVRDPLTELAVTVEGFTAAYQALHALTHEICDGRWVVLGGGGYDLTSAVPRSWTQLLAVVSDAPIALDAPLPESWREHCQALTGWVAPSRLGDVGRAVEWKPWDAGDGDAEDPVDRAIAATRRAVLPLHGLDPLCDR